MSNNARRAERRAQHEAKYLEECERRSRMEAQYEKKFGDLERKLTALGIDPDLLREWLSES